MYYTCITRALSSFTGDGQGSAAPIARTAVYYPSEYYLVPLGI